MGLFRKTKKYDYFDAFCRMTECISEAARYLKESLESFNYADFTVCVREIHRIENSADAVKHEIVEHLAHEFITPIEREDIVELAQTLDTVVDTLDDVLRHIYMFDLKSIRPETLEFTKVIIGGCSVLEKVISEFRNFKSSKTLGGLIVEVNTYENKGDELHLEYLHKLYSEDNDGKTVLAWTTVFETLENCCDAFEDVADVVESIVMKNT